MWGVSVCLPAGGGEIHGNHLCGFGCSCERGRFVNTILFVGEHPRTFDVCWHCHDHWELVYCTGGEGVFQLENGAAIRYRQGQAVAIPPREHHKNSSREGFTNIHVTMADPAFPFRSAFLVDDDAEGHMRIAFTEAKFYYLSDIKKHELVLSALGELIASYMVVYRGQREFAQPVADLRDTIRQNYADPDFALDEAMRRMPFHYDYLRRLFRQESGVTPLEYMTRLRMKKAEVLLRVMQAGEYTMSEVASQCGYANALYFSRVFKKNYGVSPSAFGRDKTLHVQDGTGEEEKDV